MHVMLSIYTQSNIEQLTKMSIPDSVVTDVRTSPEAPAGTEQQHATTSDFSELEILSGDVNELTPAKESPPGIGGGQNPIECQVLTKTSQLEGEAEEDHALGSMKGQQGEEGYDYKLVNESLGEEEGMTCPICQLIPRVPAKVDCCGHIFCHNCITSHSKQQEDSACPLCNTKPFKWITDKSLERKINILQVHCINQSEGCTWTGELRYAQQHLQKAINTAGISVGRCEYQLTTCKKCDKTLPYGELDHHSRNKCEHLIIPCDFQFARCEFEGPEVSMPKHIQENMSKHLSLVTKHIRDNTKLIQGNDILVREEVSRKWHSIILAFSIIVVSILLYFEHTAIQSLHHELTDIHSAIQHYELEDIKKGADSRTQETEIHYLKEKCMQLESDIANLNSEITKKIGDAAKAAIEYFNATMLLAPPGGQKIKKKPNRKKKAKTAATVVPSQDPNKKKRNKKAKKSATAMPSQNPNKKNKKAKTSATVKPSQDPNKKERNKKSATATPSQNPNKKNKKAKTSATITPSQNPNKKNKKAKTSATVKPSQDPNKKERNKKSATATPSQNPNKKNKKAKTSATVKPSQKPNKKKRNKKAKKSATATPSQNPNKKTKTLATVTPSQKPNKKMKKNPPPPKKKT